MNRVLSTILGVAFVLGVSTAPAVARSAAPVATKNVSVVNFAFMPKTATVARGTTIKWKNTTATTTHTTTSNTGLWNKTLAPGATFSRTFNRTGTFRYHCTIHPSMTGSIVVS
jgi:plastocyanin